LKNIFNAFEILNFKIGENSPSRRGGIKCKVASFHSAPPVANKKSRRAASRISCGMTFGMSQMQPHFQADDWSRYYAGGRRAM